MFLIKIWYLGMQSELYLAAMKCFLVLKISHLGIMFGSWQPQQQGEGAIQPYDQQVEV